MRPRPWTRLAALPLHGPRRGLHRDASARMLDKSDQVRLSPYAYDMKTVDVVEAKTHLSRLLEEVEAGHRVALPRRQRSVATRRSANVCVALAQATADFLQQLVTADRTLMAYPAPLRWFEDF
jgi:hypothetical protein